MIGAPGAVGMDDCYESRPGSPHIVLPAKAGIHGAGGRGGYARHVQLPAGRQRPNFITSCGLNKAIVIPRSAARHAGQCSAGPDKGNPSMKRTLAAIAVSLVVAFAAACGSGGDKNSVASLPTADISSFPTPSGSQATKQPTPQPTSPAHAAETQDDSEDSDDAESLTADAPPITPEEIQELRERLGRGELSEEEAREAFLRLREQFGGGQGGIGPGGFGGSQAAGAIESIDGNTITVATELATVTVTLSENTNVSITSVLEPDGLTENAQVVVVSERIEGSNLARSITFVPEGTGGFGRGQGGFGGFGGGQGAQGGPGGLGGGQGGLAEGGVRPLIGTITDIADGGFTLETQQGPLPISMNDETVIIETRQGTVADLEIGMQVTVFGPADEEGTIDARVVNVIPESLDDVRGLGGGGRNTVDRDSAGP